MNRDAFVQMIVKFAEVIDGLESALSGEMRPTIKRDANIEVSFNPQDQTFKMNVYQNGRCIDAQMTKKWNRYKIRVVLERVNGVRPRIPWKRIVAGEKWTANVMLCGWYVERLIKPNNNVIRLVNYRTEH